MKKALFYDALDCGEGCVVRPKIDDRTALMNDGQKFDYTFSIDLDTLQCPTCLTNEYLLFKGDARNNEVAVGSLAICNKCNSNFTLEKLTI